MKEFKNLEKEMEKTSLIIGASMQPPTINKVELQKYVDVGFNVFMLNEYQYGKLGEDSYEEVTKLCETFNLPIRVNLWEGWFKEFGFDRAFTYDFKKHPLISAVYVYDEPKFRDIDMLIDSTAETEKKMPDNLIMPINLYPEYVACPYLGTTYENYIDTFFKKWIDGQRKTREVACDFYPFMQNSKGDKYMYPSWAYNHHLFAKYASRYGIELSWYIQSCNYLEHRVVEKEDILMQMYMCVAFGVHRIFCFTYGTPEQNPDFPDGCLSMLDFDGKETSMFYAVKDAIKDIRKFEKEFVNFKWQGTKTFAGKNNPDGYKTDFDYIADQLDGFKYIGEVECLEDTLITEAYDQVNGRYGYFAVNYNDPIKNKTDELKIKLADAKGATVYNGTEELVFDTDEFSITLGVGSGALIIPKTK